ncbi:MAG TPA: hypothetical protein VFI42_13835, partial [Thermomicrobiaceae bacterium]|nr:hypothetical protein [Thermomicrobiaceae bacterium]
VDPESMDSVLWALSYSMQPHRDAEIIRGKVPRLDPSIPTGPDGLPDSVCNPGDPVCFVTVRGPFSFDFSLPVQPSGTSQPATPQPPSAAAPTPAPMIPTPPPVTTVRDTGAWQLMYVTYDGQPAAGVEYDARSRDGILAYRDAVRQLGARAFDHHDQVPALLTLTHPLSTEAFAALIHDAGATVKSYRYRTMDASGTRGTMGFPAGPNGEIGAPDDPTDKSGQPYNVHGVIDADIVVDADSYARLSQSPDVFLVDVMRAVADDTLREQGLTAPALDDISLTAPYWFMEDTGLTQIP